MKVLVGCEYSGRVRDAFIRKGHDAISCDLLDSLAPGPHLKKDIRDVDLTDYDLMIVFPPCTYLAYSGNLWYGRFWDRIEHIWIDHPARLRAMEFIKWLLAVPVPKLCLENPRGAISEYRRMNQRIQPYEFGHPESKETHLWLNNLPPLVPTNNVKEEMMKLPLKERQRIHRMGQQKLRGHKKSITYEGIAQAMADQWG